MWVALLNPSVLNEKAIIRELAVVLSHRNAKVRRGGEQAPLYPGAVFACAASRSVCSPVSWSTWISATLARLSSSERW
jgi:hypothetical protein